MEKEAEKLEFFKKEEIQTMKKDIAELKKLEFEKERQKGMLVNNLKAAVLSVLGSCVSLGVLVENKDPKEIIADVRKGIYDNIINNEITTVSQEKKAQLDSFFSSLKAKQDEILKKEAEEVAAKAESQQKEKAEATKAIEEEKKEKK
jgi:septal ring factor EnvC (AmiA/AmiB activator)